MTGVLVGRWTIPESLDSDAMVSTLRVGPAGAHDARVSATDEAQEAVRAGFTPWFCIEEGFSGVQQAPLVIPGLALRHPRHPTLLLRLMRFERGVHATLFSADARGVIVRTTAFSRGWPHPPFAVASLDGVPNWIFPVAAWLLARAPDAEVADRPRVGMHAGITDATATFGDIIRAHEARLVAVDVHPVALLDPAAGASICTRAGAVVADGVVWLHARAMTLRILAFVGGVVAAEAMWLFTGHWSEAQAWVGVLAGLIGWSFAGFATAGAKDPKGAAFGALAALLTAALAWLGPSDLPPVGGGIVVSALAALAGTLLRWGMFGRWRNLVLRFQPSPRPRPLAPATDLRGRPLDLSDDGAPDDPKPGRPQGSPTQPG